MHGLHGLVKSDNKALFDPLRYIYYIWWPVKTDKNWTDQ